MQSKGQGIKTPLQKQLKINSCTMHFSHILRDSSVSLQN